MIDERADRWIVRARGSTLVGVRAESNLLRLEFDTGLVLDIAGTWRATIGPARAASAVDADEVRKHLGTTVLSLVLFASGSVRIVLSDGLMIVAHSRNETKISSSLEGRFRWAAADETVTCWLGEFA